MTQPPPQPPATPPASVAQLRQLLAPPSLPAAQTRAQQLLAAATPTPLTSSSLSNLLSPLLATEQAKSARLSSQLAQSAAATSTLLGATQQQLASVLTRTAELSSNHESLQDALIDHREALVSSLAQREQTEHGQDQGTTLLERLKAFSQQRKQLEIAKQWFAVLARAEELGIVSLRALEDAGLPEALQGYVDLVDYIKTIHAGAPSLTLTSHLVAMASSVWTQLVKALSARLLQRLEAMGWPTPLKDPLEIYDAKTAEFRKAFADLLALERTQINHPLPTSPNTASSDSPTPAKPLLALGPLVHPLLLRFHWHFDGDRNTNRIDKPEYPLSHVLNLLSAHDRFLSGEVQDLLDANGFSDADAIVDFTTLLLPPLAARINHHIPQLLSMPPVLAHTIFQTLEFDNVLRSRNYRPRGLQGEWKGLSDLILGKKEWFEAWLEGEREFFDTRYYTAISASDAWQIIPEEDYDAGDARSGSRPTTSALRVAELAQLIADRYRPLPMFYCVPFLLSLHLPLLVSYAQRITSSLDAFESLSFGLLPGALATTTAATAGVGGIVRLVRAGVSARWMSEKCAEWGEDAFFLTLYDYLSSNASAPDLQPLAQAVLAESEGTLFDRERKAFETLADRSEDLIVRHVVREVLGELKTYLGRRWDFDASEEDEQSLTPDLIAPLSLFSALLSNLVAAYPPAVATTLYRRISVNLSTSLYDRLLINRTWSESGAHQLNYDLEHGFLQAGREAGIRRGVAKGWELLVGGAKIMALPGSNSSGTSAYGVDAKAQMTFSRVMQLAFDDAVPEGEGTKFNVAMEELGVGEVLGKVEVQQVMRRRPECWR